MNIPGKVQEPRTGQPLILHWSLALAIIAVVATGCRKTVDKEVERRVVDVISTNSVVAETVAAGHFLKELQMQGRLPGISRDDHGEMKSGSMDFSELEAVKYPVSRTFYIIKEGDESKSRYYYEFYRQSNVYEWRLTKAWKTDSEGKLLEELEVRP
jgi:hypothetical protein